MKRVYLFLVMLLACLSIVGQTKYTTVALNLREGPGINNRVVMVLPKGTPVIIDDDCNCKWIPVRYGSCIGYVKASYLSKNRVSYGRRKLSRSHTAYRNRYYTNSYGNRVQSPTRYRGRPAGATALCSDGTYSFSQSRRGTCSHHGGVAKWY